MFCYSESPANTSGAAGSMRAALLVAVALVAALLGSSAAGPAAAQDSAATFSGTVAAPSGVSTADVAVTVVAGCWGECAAGLADDGSQRPRPLEGYSVVYLAETGVDSSGRWSVTVTRGENLENLTLMVWDRSANLATRFIDGYGYEQLWSWESLSGIDVELEAGGRVSGRFTGSDGGPPPDGDYALWGSGDWLLDVDLQTGEFTSPPVPPGTYRIAHGNHGAGHLANNAAAEVEVAAGQTTNAGTVEVLRAGRITVAVADADGQPLQGIPVTGWITSQNPYQSMPPSPFYTTGTGFFQAATGDDGTHTAQDLYPGDDWQMTVHIPTDDRYTAITAAVNRTCAIAADQTIDCWGGSWYGQTYPRDGQYTAIAASNDHACAIAADQTIDCWGGNWSGQADAPDGQYTAIAAGANHACAIAADQTINCWGLNPVGQTDAPDGQYTAIATGGDYTCAIAADQTIDCWGSSWYGRADAPDGQYTAIAAGGSHACAIAADQTIECWGNNGEGRADAPDGQYTAIAAGGSHACAIAADQTIDCWGWNSDGQTDAPDGQYTAIAAGGSHACAIAADQTIDCWGNILGLQLTPPSVTTSITLEGVPVGSGGTTTVPVTVSDSGETTTDVSRTSDEDDSGETATDDPSDTGDDQDSTGQTEPGDDQDSTGQTEPGDDQDSTGQTEPGDDQDSTGQTEPGDGASDPTDIEDDSDGGTEPGNGDASGETGGGTEDTGDGASDPTDTEEDTGDGGAAELCFGVHKFGAEPVDVAKSADGQAVLAQLSWGYHDSIGCYLTLDEGALGVLQAAAAPEGFPAGDAGAAQRCFDHHKFGAEPVDVAKSADRQTVLAQVSWGYHESFGCYLALDPASTAALRAAHT